MKSIRTGLSLAWIAILILGLALTGCSPVSSGEIIYYEETKIITGEEAENIIEVTDNRTEILFKEVTPFVASIEPGDVLMCEHPVPGAEYGLLARVTGINTTSYGFLEGVTGLAEGRTIVQVEPATLEDAIEEGVIEVTQVIPQEDLMSGALWTTGVQVLQSETGYGFSYSPAEGVTIEGHLLVTADADVSVKASFRRGLEEFEFVFSPGLEMGATLTVEKGVSWDKQYTIASIPGPPIPIWGPVTITPSIDLVVGTDGTIVASLETSVSYERSYDVGVRYYRGTWSTISEVRGEGASLEPLSFTGQADAKVYGGAVLSGTAGVSYVAEAALRTELLGNIRGLGEIESSPWRWQYDLDLYLTAQVLADLNLLRIAHVSWESDVWQYPDPAYNLAYGASGRVTTEGGKGLDGVTINFSGGQSSVTTNADGYWCKHLLRGRVQATPEKTGYRFGPAAMTITGSASNLNFLGRASVYTPMVAAGGYHTVGLKSDGTVVAVGWNTYGQCDVGSWTDIVQVAAGEGHTVGLKSDGTVVAVGYNTYGQCDVDNWTDIVQVAAGEGHTVGVKSDGTVVAVGSNSYGQCNVDDWMDIVQVATGVDFAYHTVGVKSDGTVVAVGYNFFEQCDVDNWTDIVQVAAGEGHTVGVKSDGTVVAVGSNYYGQCNVDGWTDITQVTAVWDHTVGLKSDGTVVAVGWNDYGQCDVGGWIDITHVAAGGIEFAWYTVGLKDDGTVVAVGNNDYGQCDVGGWTLIV